MSRYWKEFPYKSMSVEELRERAQASSEHHAGRRAYEPVVVEGRAICNSWWGNAWCENLEQYADYANRIGRGRSYVRNGAVIDLQIMKGHVKALVQGSRSRPYRIEINVSPLSEERCQAVMARCGRRISDLETLASGAFPDDLKELFTGSAGLFPTPKEISFRCSCPDWALMCKHVAAALYGIGARFDSRPLLFFTLRGVDIDRFIDVAVDSRVESMLANADRPSHRIVNDSAVLGAFGVLGET